MAIQLGSAYGKVSIDSSGVRRGVNDAVQSMGTLQSKARALGKTLENIGKTMTVAFTVPLAMMAKEAVMTASAYEESLNKMKVVFKDNADEVAKWAKSATTNLGMTSQQALEASATFGNLFTSMGLARDESARMSMDLTQLAIDLASFNNISVDEALIKLRSGLVGETEPLRTLGVNLTQATVEAKAFEMGLADANGELSYAALLQARYALILEQTANAQGDFARTSNSLANQIRIFKANWGETLRILGDMLLPIVTKLLIKFNEFLTWFNSAPPYVQKLIGIILLLVAVAGPLLFVFGKLLPLAFSGATRSLNPFSGGIFGLIGTIVKWIGVAAMIVKILTALGIATGPVGAGILAVQAAIAGVGATIMSVLLPIILIVGALALLYWAFKTNFMGITTTAKQLWFIIKYYFSEGWKWLMSSVQQGGKRVAEWFRNMTQKIVDYFKRIKWSDIGKFIILGIVNGLLGGLPLVIAAAVKVAAAALNAVKQKLGIHSKSTEFMKIGAFSGEGYQAGLAKMMDPATIAKTMAKPSNSFVTSSRANYQMNFGNGLTVRDVDRLMEQKLANFTRQLNKAVGAA